MCKKCSLYGHAVKEENVVRPIRIDGKDYRVHVCKKCGCKFCQQVDSSKRRKYIDNTPKFPEIYYY